jgi:molecular chaperone DnaK
LDKKKDETIAVFDFGGGTFDISILEVGEGVVEVKSTNGDTHLGGDDIDEALVGWIIDEFKKDQGIDLHNDKMALQRLKESAEKAKVELSSTMETEINLPFITADASGPKHLVMKLTRSKFEQLVEPLLKRLMPPVEQAIKDAGLEPKDIEEIVLVGGSTRIPKVQRMVKGFFGKEPNKSVNPDEVVALGAAGSGRRAWRREDGHSASRRYASDARYRNARRCDDADDLAQHDDPDSQVRDLLHRVGQSDIRSKFTCFRENVRWPATTRRLANSISLEFPPAPRGVPQVEVTFDIDANGIVNVSAKDVGTGREQKITITASSGSLEGRDR